MKTICLFLVLWFSIPFAQAETESREPMLVYIPYVERAGTHRKYLDELLDLALEVSVEKYGPYRLVKQNRQTVMRRQLLDLVKGENLSVSPAMPSADWLRDAQIVQIPVMKGLASYRLFFAHKKNSKTKGVFERNIRILRREFFP